MEKVQLLKENQKDSLQKDRMMGICNRNYMYGVEQESKISISQTATGHSVPQRTLQIVRQYKEELMLMFSTVEILKLLPKQLQLQLRYILLPKSLCHYKINNIVM